MSGWLAVLFAVVYPSIGEGLGTGPGLGLDARDHHPNVHTLSPNTVQESHRG